MNTVFTRIAAAFEGSIGASDRSEPSPRDANNPDRPPDTGFATGQRLLGTVNTRTRMTVGEAGTEQVAIIRNPRQLIAGLGGSGSVVQVIVTGNQIAANDPNDLERWADLLTRKVEERLGRRMSGYGVTAAR